MKLQSLSLHGFKSFGDRTLIEIRDGLTAVVGSNGCGKSNVADAVRWVLGEQRASALRGTRMDEVIFQGTRTRRPLQMAEVSLRFSNEQGRLAIPQTEIEIQRKVFREGGSEYSLNGTACRLRDIQDLLRDTGLGSDAYSIIEGSMIETILSDRTEERRLLFEEAAGIGGYKERRRIAARKLERADGDLARLDDLIHEVDSKVRSLARQRGRAQRYTELRERKLALDVAVAGAQVEEIERKEGERRQRLRETVEALENVAAERSATEARVEKTKAEATLLAGQRKERAGGLEEVQRSVEEEERLILVADERGRAAEERIRDLVEEKATLGRRREEASRGMEELQKTAERIEQEMETLRRRHAEAAEAAANVRERLQTLRSEAGDRARRASERAREVAELEASRSATITRRQDAERRLAARAERLAEVEAALDQTSAQVDLFERTVEEAEQNVRLRQEESEKASHVLEGLRDREQAVVEQARAAESAVAELQANVGALESILDSDEDLSPAAAALLRERDRFPGVHGPLVEYVGGAGDRLARRLDQYLGGLARAIVVQDRESVERIRTWFRTEWPEGGSVVLLPLDSPALGGDTASSGPQLGHGAGRPWVEALLARFPTGEIPGDPLDPERWGTPGVAEDGTVVDARGIVRLSREAGQDGVFARRERLARLRGQLDEAHAGLSGARGRLDELRSQIDEARTVRDGAMTKLAEAEELLRRARGDAASHEERQRQRERERAELKEGVARLENEISEADAGLEQSEQRLERARADLQEVSSEADAAQSSLAEVEGGWEKARSEEAEMRIALAQMDASAGEARNRMQTARVERERSTERAEEIDRIVARIRTELEEQRSVRSSAAANLEAAFARRDEARTRLAEIDERLGELEADITRRESRLRELRSRQSELAELRHALDLEETGHAATRERLRERVEVEWGQPWRVLAERAGRPDEGSVEDWRRESAEVAERLDRLGPINMLAIEEHEEETKRLEFLRRQREDLVSARDDLSSAIREINRTAKEIFLRTFETARSHFRETFLSLFEGGECDVWLEDPDDPLESPIEVHAAPRGKRTRSLSQLSGGERTLTALSLLFGIYLVKPSPFCVLDEVDAPLDESNVGRFVRMLERFKEQTQFIVITHNPRTMEAADWIYGVTMEEPGVSTVVGVELDEARAYGEAVA